MTIRKEPLVSIQKFNTIKKVPTQSGVILFPTPEALVTYLQSRFVKFDDIYIDTYEKQIVEFDKIIALITHLGHLPSDMELNLNELTK